MKFRVLKTSELSDWYFDRKFDFDGIRENDRKHLADLYCYDFTDFCKLTGAIKFNNYYKERSDYRDNMVHAPNFWLDGNESKLVKWFKDGSIQERLDDDSFIAVRRQTHLFSSSDCHIGVRPIINLKEVNSDDVISVKNGNILYGEYLQDTVDSNFADYCDYMFEINQVILTGKKYTVNGEEYDEYLIDGRKMALVESALGISYGDDCSNGRRYSKGSKVWVEVKPIEWILINENEAISKSVLFPSMYNEKHCDFEDSVLCNNLNDIFAKEIVPSSFIKIEDMDKDEILSMYNKLIETCIELESNNRNLVSKINDLTNLINDALTTVSTLASKIHVPNKKGKKFSKGC